MGENISINVTGLKERYRKSSNFFKQKKVIWGVVAIIFLAFLIGGTMIRTQNISLLKDSTTGEFIPQALDPFYFLRLSETIVEQGGLPSVDNMRYPAAMVGFIDEILPQANVLLFNIWKIFDSDVSLQYVNIISPVVYFILSLIVFFFLIYYLTNSKATALVSSIFLSVITPFIHRTSAGFSDHEAIGTFAFFLVLLGYAAALKFMDREKTEKNSFLKVILAALGVGFLTAFTVAAWGGVANFVFIIFPLSFMILWIVRTGNNGNTNILKYLSFYSVWLISGVLLTAVFGVSLSIVLNRFILSSNGIITLFVLGFLISEYLLTNLIKRGNEFLRKREKYRVFISLLLVIIAGAILISLKGENFIAFSGEIINRLYTPFSGRTGSTVAENAAAFLSTWISQTGKIFFWIFFLGTALFGIKLSRKVPEKKRFLFAFAWLVLVSGIIFSKISPSSSLNGDTFLSIFIYYGSIIFFLLVFGAIYLKDKIRLSSNEILIMSWVLLMIIAGKGSIRLFFVLVPVMAFISGYAIVNLFVYLRKVKDDLLRMLLFILFAIVLLGVVVSTINFIDASSDQVKFAGPSAGIQWQQAMSWVRENTSPGDIFVHWWDYGYWVQYLGERPTVTDGGHSVKYWDHLIGRYLLTTPQPETALSFMRTHNVSYLLIDPTDFGKYGAYSRIGSDAEGNDRFSQLPIMLLEPNQIQNNGDNEIRVYQGGVSVDEDIIYNDGNQDIFLPTGRAIVAGTLLDFSGSGDSIRFNQAFAIFVYNNQQINIPLRYVYFDGKLFDFGGGLDAIARVIPSATIIGQNAQIDTLGAVIYLSPKVSNGLFARLYLLDDAFGDYPTIKLAHSEDDPLVSTLKAQNSGIEDIIYFQGFRGPIKIWETEYPSNILEKEEFLKTEGEFAELDNLQVTS